MSDERRRAERLRSSARVLWKLEGDDFLQLDRVWDVSETGAFVHTEAIPESGSRVRFELRDAAGKTIADGTARVIRVDPSTGMGIEFIDIEVDAMGVSLAMPPWKPPPLPAKGAAIASGASVARPLQRQATELPAIVIGIDLGTTNTCASWVNEGRPQIIPGRTGGNTVPSMINFEEGGRVHVGQRAADRQILFPLRTVYGSKRLIGRTWHPDLAADMQAHFAYLLGEADEQRFGVDLGDSIVSMDWVTTKVLKEVKSTAEDFLDRRVDAAVITVPAYFSEVQREAVRRAAKSAELTVHRIVNEPTAAAVAYGHRRDERARIAVWDFGGGTFDFSVVDIRDERYEVVATGGDNFIGGEDFDDVLGSYILEEFARIEELVDIEPSPRQVARLREAAELCKRALSMQSEFDVRLREFTDRPRRDLFVTVTRHAFDERTKPLIERSLSVAQGVLLAAGIMPNEINEVLLVGGTTRIPAVQRAVAELFERRPSRRINPDEAVALGAALLASEPETEGAPSLLDLLPMTVGRATDGRRFVPILKRNERLPCGETLTLDANADGAITVPLFQGEAVDVSENEYLGTVVIQDDRLRNGGAAQLRLTFDESCEMKVQASLAGNGLPVDATLDRERPLPEILGDLGTYQDAPAANRWRLPVTKIGRALARLLEYAKGSLET